MVAQNCLSNFGWGPSEEHLCEIILYLGQQFKRILSFKDFSIFYLWGPFLFWGAELYNFGRGPYEGHLCEIWIWAHIKIECCYKILYF